jgi:hypothetical protein
MTNPHHQHRAVFKKNLGARIDWLRRGMSVIQSERKNQVAKQYV